MDSGDVTQLVAIFILVLLSMFFSSAETALTTSNKLRMRSLADEGSKRAASVIRIIENPSKMLSTILIGNNIVNLSASSLATSLAISVWGNYAVGAATGVLTFIILIFGEIMPKTVATIYAEQIALAYSGIILLLMKVLTPVIFIVNVFSGLLMKLFHINKNARASTITENELRTIVDVSHEEGVIESEERRMITNVVDFGDSYAKDIMVPRIDMECVDADSSCSDLMDLFRENKYTRLPVYEESRDNIIGIINLKDIFLHKGNPDDYSIRTLMREPYFTYEFKKTSELLIEMRKNSISLAIVLDEYGATAGLITLEDLVEEIIGDIRDEYDEDEEEEIQMLSPTQYLVEGTTKLEDINEALALSLSSEEYDSIAGYVICLLGYLPEQGETA